MIHFLAGPSLKDETATFPDDGQEYYGEFRVRCPTGQARISHGHNLHQPYIIHLVGPYLDDAGQVCYRTTHVMYVVCRLIALNWRFHEVQIC